MALQDALLSNADSLLTAALSVLDTGNVGLARSLATLGLEESGKAIAIHQRRVAIVRAPEGEGFRTEELDRLWGSHELKLDAVYRFLLDEEYWLDSEPPDRDENEGFLGTIKSWSKRHDRAKQRGFYVEIDRAGDPIRPADLASGAELRSVIEHVHQIGWQIRLGEHIEGNNRMSAKQASRRIQTRT